MKYLLYCVFGSVPQPELGAPAGVEGKPVVVVDHGGLGAAISELGESDSFPDVAAILAYESVVESFFSRQTIIPMRYGCTVRDRSELAAVLDEHRKEYDALLARLDGLVEMGLQVPVDDCEVDATVPPSRFHDAGRSGASYLSAKKMYYNSADQVVERRDQLVKTLCLPLSGLFVQRKVELPSRGAILLSVYFLVPRTSIEAFRVASQQCLKDGLTKPLVSGPWPPYNFAVSSNIR